jgi:hypothetical protein
MDVKILGDFHKSLVCFFDELIEMFPSEQEFILIRILVKDQIPSTQIMTYFEYVVDNKEIMLSIQKRDDKFFLNNILFSKIIKNSDVFKNIWLTKLNKDDKDVIWTWVDSFMHTTREYKKYKNN